MAVLHELRELCITMPPVNVSLYFCFKYRRRSKRNQEAVENDLVQSQETVTSHDPSQSVTERATPLPPTPVVPIEATNDLGKT